MNPQTPEHMILSNEQLRALLADKEREVAEAKRRASDFNEDARVTHAELTIANQKRTKLREALERAKQEITFTAATFKERQLFQQDIDQALAFDSEDKPPERKFDPAYIREHAGEVHMQLARLESRPTPATFVTADMVKEATKDVDLAVAYPSGYEIIAAYINRALSRSPWRPISTPPTEKDGVPQFYDEERKEQVPSVLWLDAEGDVFVGAWNFKEHPDNPPMIAWHPISSDLPPLPATPAPKPVDHAFESWWWSEALNLGIVTGQHDAKIIWNAALNTKKGTV